MYRLPESPSSNLNRWDPWYQDATEARPYGESVSYRAAAEWLSGLDVEDWGCGFGWFARFHDAGYTGVDGTRSKWCDVHADLTRYRSSTPGLLLRHVLEHNRDWLLVLANACESFTDRMFIALFTPPADETVELVADVAGLGVPDIAFRLEDITAVLPGSWTVETVESTETGYQVETLIRVER